MRHALRHPSVAALAREPRLLNIAREVLGAEALPFRATLFDKSPQANWLVVWHQDTALPLRERHGSPSWGPWSDAPGELPAVPSLAERNRGSEGVVVTHWKTSGLAGLEIIHRGETGSGWRHW